MGLMECDVVVVGGGVAGLAIAERLAREARRQDRQITIVLAEEGARIGGGASSGLEGWFHAGGLYAKNDDSRFFFTCLNGFEDLYNWYRHDPLFGSRAHCNVEELTDACSAPRYRFGDQGWFLGRVSYVLPREVGPPGFWEQAAVDLQQTIDARYRQPAWDASRARVRDLIGRSLVDRDWRGGRLTSAQAPHPEAVRGISAAGLASSEMISCLARVVRHPIESGFDVLVSGDAVMDSTRVLGDLAESAVANGVSVLTGWRLDPHSVHVLPRSSTIDCIDLRRASGKKDETLRVNATQFIFALGAGFEGAGLLGTLQVAMDPVTTKSVVAVAEPALCEESFARIDPYDENDFNHLARRMPSGQLISLLGDSNAFPNHASQAECDAAGRMLLDKAASVFGAERLRRSLTGWYVCSKTELSGSQRDYSYWYGPRLEWHSQPWVEARRQGQGAVVEQVKNHVLDGAGDLPDELSRSSWALQEAVHFAVLARFADRQLGDGETARRRFERAQELAVSAHDEACRKISAQRSNFLNVLPGKFSLFATLAHKVYLEMEARGLFRKLKPSRGGTPPLRAGSQSGKIPVAQTHAERLLARLRGAELGSTGDQENSRCV